MIAPIIAAQTSINYRENLANGGAVAESRCVHFRRSLSNLLGFNYERRNEKTTLIEIIGMKLNVSRQDIENLHKKQGNIFIVYPSDDDQTRTKVPVRNLELTKLLRKQNEKITLFRPLVRQGFPLGNPSQY